MAAATTLPVPSSFLITRWNIFKGKFIREVKGKQNKAPSERTNIKKQTHFQIIALLSFKVHPRLAGSGLGTRSQASICTEAFVWPNYTDLSFKFFCLGLSVRTGMIAGTHGDFEYSPLIPKINANLPLVSLSTFTSSGSCGSWFGKGREQHFLAHSAYFNLQKMEFTVISAFILWGSLKVSKIPALLLTHLGFSFWFFGSKFLIS